jgi:hypothetical protein
MRISEIRVIAETRDQEKESEQYDAALPRHELKDDNHAHHKISRNAAVQTAVLQEKHGEQDVTKDDDRDPFPLRMQAISIADYDQQRDGHDHDALDRHDDPIGSFDDMHDDGKQDRKKTDQADHIENPGVERQVIGINIARQISVQQFHYVTI